MINVCNGTLTLDGAVHRPLFLVQSSFLWLEMQWDATRSAPNFNSDASPLTSTTVDRHHFAFCLAPPNFALSGTMVNSSVLWVIKSLAATTSIMMICSPSISMYRIHGKKDVGVASVIPLASLLANGHMWMLYGYMVENWFPIFWIFVFGDVAALLYIAVYWRYTTERRYVGRVLAVVFSTIAVVTLYAVVGGLGYTGQSRHQVGSTLGFICDVVAVCLYGAPMEKLLHVLKYRSAVFINAHMVVAGLSNNCTWITYGILTRNWFIISPNILFISLNSFTLVLYLVFNPKTHPLPDNFHHPTGQNAVESVISVELTPKESFSRKMAGSELPSPANFEALASPLETLPW